MEIRKGANAQITARVMTQHSFVCAGVWERQQALRKGHGLKSDHLAMDQTLLPPVGDLGYTCYLNSKCFLICRGEYYLPCKVIKTI